MPAPKFAHVVFETGQPEQMRNRYCAVLDGHVVMKGQENAADSAGPAVDPEEMLAARHAGATVEDLSGRAWALKAELPDPTGVLLGAE